MRDSDQSVQIDDKLLELVSSSARPVSRRGIYITFGVIVLMLAVFAYVSWAVSIETRKLETEAQVAMTQSIARQFERRMLVFSEQLKELAARASPGPVCAAASELFGRYVEFTELSVVNREGVISQSCSTPMVLEAAPRRAGVKLETAQSLRALARADGISTAALSLPYRLSQNSAIYTDLVLPAGNGRFWVARIALISMLRQFTETTLGYRYKISLLVDGREVLAASPVAGPKSALPKTPSDNIRTTSPLTPLPQAVQLLVVNTHMDSAYGYTKLIAGLIFFGCLLVLSMLGILIYQYRQIKTEEELRARIIVQQTMSQSILDGLMVTDRTGKILYTNHAFSELMADAPGEAIGMTPPYRFCPQDQKVFDFEGHLGESGAGDIVRAEFNARRKDGSRFVCAAEILPLRSLSEGGRQPGWLVTLRDITQQKRSRQALAVAHERTIRVLESMDSAVSVAYVNPDGTCELLYANARYIEVFGNTGAAHQRLAALIKEQGPVAQSSAVYDEATRRWFFIGARNITWMGGRPAELLTIQDVTVKKEHEEMLEQQQKNAEQASRLMTMGELASSLAHELNQPLAAVQNYASATLTMLKAGKLTEAGVEAGLNKIINQTQRAAQIIRRIRGFAKRGETVRVPAAVSHILDETLELAQLQAKKYGMTIALDISAGSETIVCDPVLIEQVLINLLKNAMEASLQTHAQQVRLTVRRLPRAVEFTIADQGCGIDAEAARHIFDPFYSTKRTGMGIGLNICRSIVESHHGRLSFEPNPEGGTIFKLLLPASPAAAGSPADTQTGASSQEK